MCAFRSGDATFTRLKAAIRVSIQVGQKRLFAVQKSQYEWKKRATCQLPKEPDSFSDLLQSAGKQALQSEIKGIKLKLLQRGD